MTLNDSFTVLFNVCVVYQFFIARDSWVFYWSLIPEATFSQVIVKIKISRIISTLVCSEFRVAIAKGYLLLLYSIALRKRFAIQPFSYTNIYLFFDLWWMFSFQYKYHCLHDLVPIDCHYTIYMLQGTNIQHEEIFCLGLILTIVYEWTCIYNLVYCWKWMPLYM